MASSVREALGVFDRFSVILQGAFAQFAGVVVQWLPDDAECLVVAALGDDGEELELADPSLLQVWSESLPYPVPVGAVRLLAGRGDVSTSVEFSLWRDEALWRRVLPCTLPVAGQVQDGSAGELLAASAWLALSSVQAPSGGVLVGEGGEVTGVCAGADGSGSRMVWPEVTGRVGETAAEQLRAVCAGLAVSVPAGVRVVPLVEQPVG